MIPTEGMIEYRCAARGHLLFRGVLAPGSRIEVMCDRCKEDRVTKFAAL